MFATPHICRHGLRAAAVVASLVLISACAASGTGQKAPEGPGSGNDGSVSSDVLPVGPAAPDLGMPCDVTAPDPDRPVPPREVLPASFVPVELRVCTLVTRTYADGEWQVRVVKSATSGLAALAEALRKPSEKARNATCPAIGYLMPDITLIDAAGDTFRPAIPTGVCGMPHRDALALLDGLSYTTASETKVTLLTSAAALATGCSQLSKNVMRIYDHDPQGPVDAPPPLPAKDPAVEPVGPTAMPPRGGMTGGDDVPQTGSGGGSSASSPGSSAGSPGSADDGVSVEPAGPAAPEDTSVCVYTVPGPGGDRDGGTFERGGHISTDALRAVLAGVSKTAPACAREATRYAVLNAGTYVELDGCQRVRGDAWSGLGLSGSVQTPLAATPALLRLIATAAPRS